VGVGECETGRVHCHTAVDYDVYVDGAVTVCAVGIAVWLGRNHSFDVLESVEQLQWIEGCFYVDADIDESVV